MTLTSMLSPASHSEITPTGLSSSISEMCTRPVVSGAIATNSLWARHVTLWQVSDEGSQKAWQVVEALRSHAWRSCA